MHKATSLDKEEHLGEIDLEEVINGNVTYENSDIKFDITDFILEELEITDEFTISETLWGHKKWDLDINYHYRPEKLKTEKQLVLKNHTTSQWYYPFWEKETDSLNFDANSSVISQVPEYVKKAINDIVKNF